MEIVEEDTTLTLYHHPAVLLGYIKRFQISPRAEEPYVDAWQFFNDADEMLTRLARIQQDEIGSFKLQLRLRVQFVKPTDEEATTSAVFNSLQHRILRNNNPRFIFPTIYEDIAEKIERFQALGSGWVVSLIDHCDIHIAKYRPLAAAGYIQLPRTLARRGAIVNIKNTDNMCFLWCVLAKMYPVEKNGMRPNQYRQYLSELNITGITFPVTLDQIESFERLNRIAINVFEYEATTQILYSSSLSGTDIRETVNLLRLEQDGNSHYCLIRDLNRLLSTETRDKYRKFFCTRCLLHFSTECKLDEHAAMCTSEQNQRAVMPPPHDNKLQFQNWGKSLRQPLVIYADFECLLRREQSCAPNPSVSSTRCLQHHEVCSYALVSVLQCCDESTRKTSHFSHGRKANVVIEFLETILTIGKQYQEQIDSASGISMTTLQWQQFHRASKCHICTKSFSSCSNDYCSENTLCSVCRRQRVRDHCHICNSYRGAAHSQCNLQYRLNRDIIVVFHNLRRYDGHLIMQQIGSVANSKNLSISCIPKGMEDYLTFSLHVPHQKRRHLNNKAGLKTWKIRFIDSFQFLSTSLDNLVTSLAKQGEGMFHCLQEQYPNYADRQLLLQKGIYCYDYMDNWNRFDESRLPSQDKFFNSLTGSALSNEDYQRANTIWNHFKMLNLGDYHDLYLKTDTILLADVFESFRAFALANYRLDPAKYFTLPSFSWDACLLFTKVTLDLLTDEAMYQFFEQGIRGGIAVISHRLAQANNPYLPNFDPGRIISYILYLDANNLYGWSMTQSLPSNNFTWLTESECETIDFSSLEDDADVGYLFEVDLEYPTELHVEHSSYPLAPEPLTITHEMLSDYSKRLRKNLNMPLDQNVTKLTPNLLNKTKYILHYRNLKLYLSLGMRLIRIHRAVRFTQKCWMEPYICFNAEMRKVATSDFEKDMFKLLNNAVFGKSMENVRKYVDIKLVTQPSQMRKLVANPLYECCVEFSPDLAGVKLRRNRIKLNKPIYTGFTVLDLSKLLMYQFHYNHMVKKYGERQQLLFTDTDSLTYLIETDDIYRDMLTELSLYDTSEYPSNHMLFSETQKKKPGVMKDETQGIPISEFVGLRAKMYSVLYNNKEKKRAKGVKKSVVQRQLRHEDFKQTLQKEQLLRHQMKSFRSFLHQIKTVEQNKISLSAYDDKRYVLPDGINTLAYGHASINSH